VLLLLVPPGLVQEACADGSPRVLRSPGDVRNGTLLADLANMPPPTAPAPLPAVGGQSERLAGPMPGQRDLLQAKGIVGVGANGAVATPTGSAGRLHAADSFSIPASPPWWLWLVVALAFAALFLLLACVHMAKSEEREMSTTRSKAAESARSGSRDIYEPLPTCAMSLPTAYSLPQASDPLQEQPWQAVAAAPTLKALPESEVAKAESAIMAAAVAPTMRILPSTDASPTGTTAWAPMKTAQWGAPGSAPPTQQLDVEGSAMRSAASLANCSVPTLSWLPGHRG